VLYPVCLAGVYIGSAIWWGVDFFLLPGDDASDDGVLLGQCSLMLMCFAALLAEFIGEVNTPRRSWTFVLCAFGFAASVTLAARMVGSIAACCFYGTHKLPLLFSLVEWLVVQALLHWYMRIAMAATAEQSDDTTPERHDGSGKVNDKCDPIMIV